MARATVTKATPRGQARTSPPQRLPTLSASPSKALGATTTDGVIALFLFVGLGVIAYPVVFLLNKNRVTILRQRSLGDVPLAAFSASSFRLFTASPALRIAPSQTAASLAIAFRTCVAGFPSPQPPALAS